MTFGSDSAGKFPPIERFSSEFLHVTRPHGNSPSLVYLRTRINHMWSIWVADRTLPYVEGPCKERRSVLNAKRTIWNKRLTTAGRRDQTTLRFDARARAPKDRVP